jgi:hypothetical protein
MKKWLKIGVGAVLVAAAGFVAHMHVVAQSYYPSLRVQAPEGLMYVVVQDEKAERRECGAANDRFLARIKQGCKECRILAARCTRALEEPLERDLYKATPVKYSTVVAPGMRMAIVGPQPLADQSCVLIAQEARKQGASSTSCRRPAL